MGKRHSTKKVAGSRISTKIPTASVVVQRSPSGFGRDWPWGLVLVLLVVLAYIPVWKAGFVFDDRTILTANPCIVDPMGFEEIWTTKAADICPLTLTTFWAEHALWGFNPLPYHLVNVLLHGLSAVVLWRVLRRLHVPGAWLGVALWAIHPVAVESVAWIAEMKNTESGLFFLLSILFFVRWFRAKELGGATGSNYALTLLFAALAMAAKSSTVILPVVLCLCTWWMEGRLHWRYVARTVPIFLMTIAASALSIWTQGLQLATVTDPQWTQTWPQRLAIAGDAVWFYLGKLLLPYPLITIYPRWQIDAAQWVSYLPLTAMIGIFVLFWFKRKTWARPWFFAFVYFAVALLPGLGLIDNFIFRYSFVFDHFQYLASMGPLALAGAGLVRFSNLVLQEKALLQSSLGAGLLLILGVASWQRILVYKSEETLWTDTLSKNPNCWVAHFNLGNALHGQVDDAVAQYEKALEINPNFPDAQNNLGLALFQKGQVDEAIARYQKAVEINPHYTEAYSNLGLALFDKGQLDEAITQYQKALEITPKYVAARYNLGLALFQKGQLDEAITHFQKALDIQPDYAAAHNNLGNVLFQKGQLDEAIEQFKKAVEIDPEAETRFNLGNALLQKGQLDEAIEQFVKALDMNPNSFQTHYNFGAALAQRGRLDEAITQFREVLRLKPDFSPAKDALEQLQSFVRQRYDKK
jgi:tetratricopeptide (TPR) repeat protein